MQRFSVLSLDWEFDDWYFWVERPVSLSLVGPKTNPCQVDDD